MNGIKKKVVVLLLFMFTFSIGSTAFAAPDYYSVIYNEVLSTSPWLGEEGADWMARAILYSCSRWGVDPLLVTAVFKQESGFNMGSVSPVGAIGIAQLMPGTAEALGVNPCDPLQNVDGGVHYLRQQLDNFSGSGEWMTTFAVAAYNAGPGAIRKYGGVPPYSETINYVNSISSIYRQLIS